MKKILTSSLPVVVLLSLYLHTTSNAQVVNGNFETQNHAPRGSSNIAGPNSAYNDLAGWNSLSHADYLSTNATDAVVNPQGTPYTGKFSPNSANSCVAITREPGSFAFDEFITQPVNLIPNHRYQVEFYALRRPGYASAEKLELSVTDGMPRYNGGSSTKLSPSPYATVTSQAIPDNLNWTKVTGSFISKQANNYITIGYQRALAPQDNSLYQYYPGFGSIYYAIDDVSLFDMGSCTAAALITGRWECTTDCSSASNLPKQGTITGKGLVSEISLPAGEYNIYLNTVAYNPWQGPPTSSVYWYYISGGGINSAVHFRLTPGQGATFNVTTRNTAAGACGPSQLQLNFHADPTPVPYSPYRVSPNPVSDQLTITANEPATPNSTQQLSTKTSQATLFDMFGKQVKTQPMMGGKAAVDVQDLPDGLYNLRVENAGKPVIQHIQVKH